MIQIVVMSDCASNYGVYKLKGSRGAEYTVSLGGSEGPGYCTCPAFKFSGAKMDCKHIRTVWDKACMYNPQWHDAKESPELRPVDYTYDAFTGEKCRCGGPLVSVRRAV
jgi:predicted nucleic acid-binding Zn finger protein